MAGRENEDRKSGSGIEMSPVDNNLSQGVVFQGKEGSCKMENVSATFHGFHLHQGLGCCLRDPAWWSHKQTALRHANLKATECVLCAWFPPAITA